MSDSSKVLGTMNKSCSLNVPAHNSTSIFLIEWISVVQTMKYNFSGLGVHKNTSYYSSTETSALRFGRVYLNFWIIFSTKVVMP